jgi:hypothetical protein
VRTLSDTRTQRRPAAARAGWALVALALALTACGDGDGGDDDTELQARVAELEQERDAADARADSLAEENERLEAELSELRAERDDAADGEADERAEPAPVRTPEGLVDQLRAHLARPDEPEEFEPDTTDWRTFELPDGLETTHDSPGAAASALLEALEAESLGQDVWEATTRVLLDPDDQDTAYVAVLSWGWADDATEGRDVRVTLTRADDGEWELGGAEAREHCRRGVTDGMCV